MRNLYRPATVLSAWFEHLPAQQLPHVKALYGLLQQEAPDLMTVVKWGAIVMLRDHFHALGIAPCRRAVHLQVFNGGAIAHRFRSLGAGGPGMRSLQLRYSLPLDLELVREVVRASLAVVRAPRN